MQVGEAGCALLEMMRRGPPPSVYKTRCDRNGVHTLAVFNDAKDVLRQTLVFKPARRGKSKLRLRGHLARSWLDENGAHIFFRGEIEAQNRDFINVIAGDSTSLLLDGQQIDISHRELSFRCGLPPVWHNDDGSVIICGIRFHRRPLEMPRAIPRGALSWRRIKLHRM